MNADFDYIQEPIHLKMRRLNPGSPEAVKAGCTCPIAENNHGRGAQGNPDCFWFNDECPLHGWEAKLKGDL
jgi:hypothetical protein